MSVPVGRVKPGVSRLVATAQSALNEALGAVRARPDERVSWAASWRPPSSAAARACCASCRATASAARSTRARAVPNYADPDAPQSSTEGMVLTIEPIIAQSTRETVTEDDGWTISTDDGSVSAHAEHTLVVRDGRP